MKEIKHDSKKLTVRDLVTTGIFCAVFFVFMLLGAGFLAPNPILTFAMPCGVALMTGPVYLLLIAKTPKHGPVIILGTVIALIMFVTGMHWGWSVALVLCGIVGDLIAGIGNFRNMKLNVISFLVFSLNPMGSYGMLWIDRQNYFDYMVSKGTTQAYVDTMGAMAQNWILPAMIASILIAGLISGLVGRAILKKQFEKAGIIE